MTGPSKYAQATWLTSPNYDLASVNVLWTGKFNMVSSMESVGVIPEGVIWRPPKQYYILAKLEFVLVEYDSIFCTMKQEINSLVEGSFDIGVVEKGVIYDLHFARKVLYYLIVPSGVGISRCKVHPEVHESPPFCEIFYLIGQNGICQQCLRLLSFV